MDVDLSIYNIKKVTVELYSDSSNASSESSNVRLLSLTWNDEIAQKIDWDEIRQNTFLGDYGNIFRIAEDYHVHSLLRPNLKL